MENDSSPSWKLPNELAGALAAHHSADAVEFLPCIVRVADLLVRSRMPNCPADERLCFALNDLPAYQRIIAENPNVARDLEALTFQIDDELGHALTFVETVFRDS